MGAWAATLLVIVVVATFTMSADVSLLTVVPGVVLLLTLPLVLHRRVEPAPARVRSRRPRLPAPSHRD